MPSVFLRQQINYIQPQGSIPCCTACSTLLAAEMIMSEAGHKLNFSRLYLYYMTRKLQCRLGEKGAELRTTMEALSTYGVPPERYWPFHFARVDREPHLEALNNAANYRLQEYKEIAPENYKFYLDIGVPVVIGIRTGRMFWKMVGELSEQVYKPVNDVDNFRSNGHAATIVGYDDNLNGGSWIIANSLGPKWGFQGYGAIPYSCNVDIGEAYIITKFAGIATENFSSHLDK